MATAATVTIQLFTACALPGRQANILLHSTSEVMHRCYLINHSLCVCLCVVRLAVNVCGDREVYLQCGDISSGTHFIKVLIKT